MTNLELDNQLVETLDVRACFGNVAATDPDYQYDPGSDRWFSTVINGAGTGTDLAIESGVAAGPLLRVLYLRQLVLEWSRAVDRPTEIDSDRQ